MCTHTKHMQMHGSMYLCNYIHPKHAQEQIHAHATHTTPPTLTHTYRICGALALWRPEDIHCLNSRCECNQISPCWVRSHKNETMFMFASTVVAEEVLADIRHAWDLIRTYLLPTVYLRLLQLFSGCFFNTQEVVTILNELIRSALNWPSSQREFQDNSLMGMYGWEN